MGHKIFFMFCFLFVIGGIAFMTAFSLNGFPPPVYEFMYEVFSIGSPKSTYPYFTKFEGHWQLDLTPSVAQTKVTQCDMQSGTVIIHDGHMTGTAGALNKFVSVTADVTESGILHGTTARGEGNVGTIDATIIKSDGEGVWKDSSDCQGTLTLKKLDPYLDPSKGFLVSYTGEVMLTRGDTRRLPNPGQLLYVGDEIDVSSNGSAYLSIGLNTVSLTSGMSYTVSDK